MVPLTEINLIVLPSFIIVQKAREVAYRIAIAHGAPFIKWQRAALVLTIEGAILSVRIIGSARPTVNLSVESGAIPEESLPVSMVYVSFLFCIGHVRRDVPQGRWGPKQREPRRQTY